MENDNIKKQIVTIFWVFIVGSIFGSVIETIDEVLIEGNLHLRRGLIYGPFIPVYGVGAVMYYYVVSNSKEPIKVFLTSMALGGLVEYGCSYIQEIFFGTISWDYSASVVNLNGRTDLIHCIFWGITGIFYITIAYPAIMKFISLHTRKDFKIATIAMAIFISLNIFISCAAGARQNERVKGIEANGLFAEFLDKYYPDSKMDKVYSNKIVTINRSRNEKT